MSGDSTSPANDAPGAAGPVGVRTSDGIYLEAEVALGVAPGAAVVLAHPHPAHGGSMRSLVTSELFGTLPGLGVAALRFNFRGVGDSGGAHGGGEPERLDVTAAIGVMARLVPGVPLVVSGWSFGADVSLAVDDPALDGWFAVAPPLRILPAGLLVAAHDPRPKVLAVPEHDQFNPPERCAEKTSGWVNTRRDVVAGGDHFLVGRTQVVAGWLAAFARDPHPPAAP
jgi:alpha/beta superfamily hydrolase